MVPAVTLVLTRDPWWSFGSPVLQPEVSSLHARSGPLSQLGPRTVTTVSKLVAAPQVSSTTVPERGATQLYTVSGAGTLFAQLAAKTPVPLVDPANVPPSLGRAMAEAQAAAGVAAVVGVGVNVRVGVAVLVGVAPGAGVAVFVGVAGATTVKA